MRSYRFARRSFLTAIGGALGLRVLLRNFEAIAAGATSPPRFMLMHWPVGTIRYMFLPSAQGTAWTISPILQPFEDMGLRDGMTVLYGLTMNSLNAAGGGGHEAGTPMATTGANCAGTRENGGEPDDAASGGPSFDQIFLQNVPALQALGAGFINTIADARVDSLETSTQCLSYSYQTRDIQATTGGMITENVPLLPQLSPTQTYLALFANFMPGGATDANQAELLRALAARKSVLDYALVELDELRRLAPAAEAPKIDLHGEAIRNVEEVIAAQLNGDLGAACTPPEPPDPNLTGGSGGTLPNGTNPQGPGVAQVTVADDVVHEAVGLAHAAVIRAAFQCDLIRVATFQWSPGTNHVSFGGLDPTQPQLIFQHHPRSHAITNFADSITALPATPARQADIMYLANVQRWYNERTAQILSDFRNTTDAFGGNLFDQTIFPYVTEVAESSHRRAPIPALIFGGSALGMQHGQFLDFDPNGTGTAGRHHNDLWMTIAQAYLNTNDPLTALALSPLHADGLPFATNNVSPIEGLWAPPV